MRLITASHITTWAAKEKRDCQGMLPILVRRLIRATVARVDQIEFPGGDAVSDEGWTRHGARRVLAIPRPAARAASHRRPERAPTARRRADRPAAARAPEARAPGQETA